MLINIHSHIIPGVDDSRPRLVSRSGPAAHGGGEWYHGYHCHAPCNRCQHHADMGQYPPQCGRTAKRSRQEWHSCHHLSRGGNGTELRAVGTDAEGPQRVLSGGSRSIFSFSVSFFPEKRPGSEAFFILPPRSDRRRQGPAGCRSLLL